MDKDENPIEAFAGLILEGTIPDARIAEMAGVSVAAVAEYRAVLTRPDAPELEPELDAHPASLAAADEPSKREARRAAREARRALQPEPRPAVAPPGAEIVQAVSELDAIDDATRDLAAAAQRLIDDHGYVLRDGDLIAPVRIERPARISVSEVIGAVAPLVIRLTEALVSSIVRNGRRVPAHFAPSIYRGDMAHVVRACAEREGAAHTIQVLEA